MISGDAGERGRRPPNEGLHAAETRRLFESPAQETLAAGPKHAPEAAQGCWGSKEPLRAEFGTECDGTFS